MGLEKTKLLGIRNLTRDESGGIVMLLIQTNEFHNIDLAPLRYAM